MSAEGVVFCEHFAAKSIVAKNGAIRFLLIYKNLD